MKLLIVAGHGAGDAGACALGLQEHALNVEVASALYSELKDKVDVTLYNTSKNLYKELRAGNYGEVAGYTDIIEIHFNACVQDLKGDGRSTGTEILVHKSRFDAKDTVLEEKLLRELCECGWKNRGVKPRSDLQNMNICNKRGINYFLIEMCFIDDKDDIKIYNDFKRWNTEVFADTLLDHWGVIVSNTGCVRYNTIEEVPSWGKETVNRLLELGHLKGDGAGFDLSYDMLRLLVINYRAGLYK